MARLGRFLLCSIFSLAALFALDQRNLVINGVRLGPSGLAVMQQLEAVYGNKVPDGRYWYDPYSGLWGREGEGTAGQILPNLKLGGKLRADASRGNTGVWINGRQLHRTEVQFLNTCVPVVPGRYWMNAQGVGGPEGSPPMYNLAQLCARSSRNTSAGGDPWYGSVMGGGGTVGAIFRDGTSVSCGPDGGCIY